MDGPTSENSISSLPSTQFAGADDSQECQDLFSLKNENKKMAL